MHIKKILLPLHPHYRSNAQDDSLAQLVEHNTFNVGVLGSSPSWITKTSKKILLKFNEFREYLFLGKTSKNSGCAGKSTDSVIEVVPSQPITPDGQDNAPAAGISVADTPPGSPSPDSIPMQDTPSAEPYVHRMPDFLADRQRIPPKLSGMPQSISIKEAMDTLDGKLVIGGVPKLGNRDDPDPDQPEKPKPKLKL